MNSDSMHPELMKVVERAVRPVRVDRGRKLRMRQELYSHLESLYEEERSRLGDDGAALEEARRRFGDPAELSRELDGSVSFWGRWNWGEERIVAAMDRTWGYRPDRSMAWHLGRTFLTSIGSGIAVVLLTYLTTLAVPDRNLTWNEATRLFPVLLFFVAITFVVHAIGLVYTRDFYDVERPRWGRIAMQTLLCVAAMTALFFAMWWGVAGDLRPMIGQAPIVVGVLALMPTGLILAVWSAEKHARPYRMWTRLRLDE